MDEFYAIWCELLAWERQLVRWFAYLLLRRRTLLPALSYQAGGMLLVIWVTPGNPLLWSFVFIVSLVYALMVVAFLRR